MRKEIQIVLCGPLTESEHCWSGLDIAAHSSDVSAAAEGSSLLSTIARGTPTPLLSRSSSVMLFSRSEMSGIPQKSVIEACSSTAVRTAPDGQRRRP